jgi:hypothetical protein
MVWPKPKVYAGGEYGYAESGPARLSRLLRSISGVFWRRGRKERGLEFLDGGHDRVVDHRSHLLRNWRSRWLTFIIRNNVICLSTPPHDRASAESFETISEFEATMMFLSKVKLTGTGTPLVPLMHNILARRCWRLCGRIFSWRNLQYKLCFARCPIKRRQS